MPVTSVCTNQTYAKSRVCPPLPGGKTLEPGLFPGRAREGCVMREHPLRTPARVRFPTTRRWRRSTAPGIANEDRGLSPTRARSVSCDDCFFRKNMLCALALEEPCPTFRPDHPEGLRPPQQLHFVFRQERRRQAAWAFPTAQEQAALHA